MTVLQEAPEVARPGGGRVALSVTGVNKTYSSAQSDVEALRDVSLEIEAGSFVSLVGPSGCGKSTLLKVIGGLISRNSGSVQISGVEVEGPSRDVGVMFQTPTLFPWRTVLENVMLPVEVFGLNREKYRREACEILELVGLGGFQNRYPRELSGGMQQRVALSRVLVFHPHYLLMDEPFGALDEFTRERLNLEILRVWTELQQTILFVTHNIAEAVFLSDRLFVMSPCPGQVAGIVDIPLPRPRGIAQMQDPLFAEKVFEVRELLGVAR